MTGTTRTVLRLIAVTALARLTLASLLGPSVDESHTVAITRQLSLSYFDHPPLPRRPAPHLSGRPAAPAPPR